ncbi:MAG: toll/interleukin-1 receptor domain-containing protein [Chloroflexi bacterium]|nr:toll/interleukin-1 receptor domain-containing protein [Chloroflexota bacterium]
MRVFISYAMPDAELARKVADGLQREGLSVWLAEREILPGDNWAEKVSQALNESQAMVVLITSETFRSRAVMREIEFALGNKEYRQRLIPVVMESERIPDEAIPWILRRYQMVRVPEGGRITDCVSDIKRALLEPA